MLDLSRIHRANLESQPYAWAAIGDLFAPKDAAALAAGYPCDHFKTVAARDGSRSYDYAARSLIVMGAGEVTHPEGLSAAWRELARDLLSPGYRVAMSLLVGRDLTEVPLEINVFHYGPRAHLSAHPDLPDKVVTHVLYFNREWEREDGGCLHILRSRDDADLFAEVLPMVGYSAVIVRSDDSWHAVSPVVEGCDLSRRSVTVTFYRPGSVSTLWPPGDTTPLRRYEAKDLRGARRA